MATVIRLARFGKRHNPIYRIVVIDNRKARDDSFIEQVGFFNPNLKQPEIRFEQEKVLKWLSVGAQPSDTVKSLLKKTGISDLFHDLKANRSIEGKAPVAREIKSKQRKLSPKAQARLEAEKAAKVKKHRLNYAFNKESRAARTGLFFLASQQSTVISF